MAYACALLAVQQCVLEGLAVSQEPRSHRADRSGVLTRAADDRIGVDPPGLGCCADWQVTRAGEEQRAVRQKCLQEHSANIALVVMGDDLTLGVSDADYFSAKGAREIEFAVKQITVIDASFAGVDKV